MSIKQPLDAQFVESLKTQARVTSLEPLFLKVRSLSFFKVIFKGSLSFSKPFFEAKGYVRRYLRGNFGARLKRHFRVRSFVKGYLDAILESRLKLGLNLFPMVMVWCPRTLLRTSFGFVWLSHGFRIGLL